MHIHSFLTMTCYLTKVSSLSIHVKFSHKYKIPEIKEILKFSWKTHIPPHHEKNPDFPCLSAKSHVLPVFSLLYKSCIKMLFQNFEGHSNSNITYRYNIKCYYLIFNQIQDKYITESPEITDTLVLGLKLKFGNLLT